MQWSEKPPNQTALTCPNTATKYNIRDLQMIKDEQNAQYTTK